MPVRILSDEVQRARSLAVEALDAEWSAEQIAAGVDGPTPPGRPAGSDYSQHYPPLEAEAADLDLFMFRLEEILT